MIYRHSAFQELGGGDGIRGGNAVRLQLGAKLTQYSGFNLVRGDMFSVGRHFVQFSGFLTERKPAPSLKGVFRRWTIYNTVGKGGQFF